MLYGHSSGASLATCLNATNPGGGTRMFLLAYVAIASRPPLFGLAPGGVYPANSVTGIAVRSYRPVSPLPLSPCGGSGGLFSVALSLGSPPPAVSRHRIPVEPGLSSTGFYPGSGRPTVWMADRLRLHSAPVNRANAEARPQVTESASPVTRSGKKCR